MNRKAIIFLPDGMADNPIAEYQDRTPLEIARTPGMDKIASLGVNGNFLTLPDGLPTSSDVANMSVLGFQPELNYPGRGPIEAVAQGIELAPDDIAWRCNLVYASNDGVLRDYSAGHISDEDARILMEDLQKEFGNDDVTFHSGVSYRNLLVLHGKKFSDKINYFKPDSSQDLPLNELYLSPADDSEEAAYTVKFLRDLEERCAEFLAKHPINALKASPGNRIWPWSPGHAPSLTPFEEKYDGRKGAIISAVDVIKGLGKCTGMKVIEVEGATGFIDTNYAGKAQAAIDAIKEYDLVYVHVEAIDECSHLGDLKLKIRAIENFDAKIVMPILAALEEMPELKVNVAVLPDHPVPIKLRAHTTDPVPLAIMGPDFEADDVNVYSEKTAPNGKLGLLNKDQLVKKLLNI